MVSGIGKKMVEASFKKGLRETLKDSFKQGGDVPPFEYVMEQFKPQLEASLNNPNVAHFNITMEDYEQWIKDVLKNVKK